MNKFFRNTLLVLTLTTSFSSSINANQDIQKPKTTKVVKKLRELLVTKAAPLSLACIYFSTFSSQEIKGNFKEQLEPKNLLKNFSTQFISYLLATIMHEVGHAITAKMFNNSPVNIHVGTNDTNKKAILCAKYFSINGFNHREGYSVLTLSRQIDTKKYAAIYLAGGMFGVLSSFLTCALTKKIDSTESNQNVFFNSIALEQLINAFLPISENSDATKIYKKSFNLSDKTINIASDVRLFLNLLGEFYLSHKETFCSQTNILDKFFMMIINNCLKGFFRFHV